MPNITSLTFPSERTIRSYLDLHPATAQLILQSHHINEVAAIHFANKTLTLDELKNEIILFLKNWGEQNIPNLQLGVIVNLGLSLTQGLQDCALNKDIKLVAKL